MTVPKQRSKMVIRTNAETRLTARKILSFEFIMSYGC